MTAAGNGSSKSPDFAAESLLRFVNWVIQAFVVYFAEAVPAWRPFAPVAAWAFVIFDIGLLVFGIRAAGRGAILSVFVFLTAAIVIAIPTAPCVIEILQDALQKRPLHAGWPP